MNGFVKFIIGAIVTSLMAMAAHSWLKLGDGFLNRLEAQAQTALGNAGAGSAVTVTMHRDPELQRVAILTGTVDAAMKDKLTAAVLAIPGVAAVEWAGPSVPEAAPEAPATAEQVQNCQTQVDAAIAGKTIQFETGSASIRADSQGLIDSLAQVLSPCQGVKVEVAGHTDTTGTPAANQTLSQQRATSVVDALVAKGVPAARLVANGYGSTQPRQPGNTPDANAANRRIEFKVASNNGAATPAAASAATPAADSAASATGGN